MKLKNRFRMIGLLGLVLSLAVALFGMSSIALAQEETGCPDGLGPNCGPTPTPPPTHTPPCTVVPYEADGWKYQIYQSGTVPTTFGAVAFDDSGFAIGNAAFGSDGYCPLQSTVVTDWPLNSDIVIRKAFYLPADASGLKVNIAIDNDVQVFLNGTDISQGLRIHENCATLNSFSFPADDSILNKNGNNVIAIMGKDRGGQSLLDAQVTVNTAGPCPPLPEVPTLGLMAAGMLALGGFIWMRNRRQTVAPEIIS